jgi:nucleoid-associated protein YgaU
VAATLALTARATGVSPDGGDLPRRYVVRAGDTLWEIARGLAGPAGDPRPAVEAIREANGLGTTPLLAGEALLIPST